MSRSFGDTHGFMDHEFAILVLEVEYVLSSQSGLGASDHEAGKVHDEGEKIAIPELLRFIVDCPKCELQDPPF